MTCELRLFFQVSSEQNGIFPMTSMDSQIIHKDFEGDLNQDTGCYVRENPVSPKSWKSLKAFLFRDYCRDTSQPLTLTDGGFLHPFLSISILSLLCHVLSCFFPVFYSGLSDAQRVAFLLQAVFRD